MGKKSFYTVWIFSKLNTKRFFRDRVAIFFAILFPLIFLFVFGGIFGKTGGVSFNVALINQSDSQFSKQFVSNLQKQKIFKIAPDVKTLDAARERMSRGSLEGAIVLPKDFGVISKSGIPTGTAEVIYTQNNEQAGQTITSVMQSQFDGINGKFVTVKTPFKVVGQKSTQKGLTQFDYTFAGLLGFSIIGLGIFGPVNVFPELKKQGILRRLHTTTLRVWQYFVSTVVTQVILGLLAMSTLFAAAILVFHLKIIGNWIELVAFLILSIVTILGIGLALGGWARNERQVAPLANIVVFPMMFLSGTFFPRFLMPEWLQGVSNYLPLTPVIDGVRLIATEGKSLVDVAPQVGLLGAWFVVIYVIAFRVFRWE